jgi:hypothetical protein
VKYVNVPKELSIAEIRANGGCFAPGRYIRFIPPHTTGTTGTTQFAPLDKLIVLREGHVTTTRAAWYHYAEIGDIDVSTGGITFHKTRGYQLPDRKPARAEKGDVLVSTVRTYRNGIGYVTANEPNLVTTNAVMNICGVTNYARDLTVLYLYSFLRSEFFSEQVWSVLNRGNYPRMDKDLLHNIVIPITSNARVINYISALMQAIVEKERAIRDKNAAMFDTMEMELSLGQVSSERFQYVLPTIDDLRTVRRLDAGMYVESFRHKRFLIQNYKHGWTNYAGFDLSTGRGQNLQLSAIGKSIYSDKEKPRFYRLLLPTNITDYGTAAKYEWLGNSRKLDVLHEGDIVFGGEATFRCVVVCDALTSPTISNIHAIILRSESLPLYKKVFVGAWLRYLAKWGYLQSIAVGGNGGSLAMGYFHHVLFPKFPDDKQAEIARLYHNPAPPPSEMPTLTTFVDWHRQWNLRRTLAEVQEKIIAGETVIIPLADTPSSTRMGSLPE